MSRVQRVVDILSLGVEEDEEELRELLWECHYKQLQKLAKMFELPMERKTSDELRILITDMFCAAVLEKGPQKGKGKRRSSGGTNNQETKRPRKASGDSSSSSILQDMNFNSTATPSIPEAHSPNSITPFPSPDFLSSRLLLPSDIPSPLSAQSIPISPVTSILSPPTDIPPIPPPTSPFPDNNNNNNNTATLPNTPTIPSNTPTTTTPPPASTTPPPTTTPPAPPQRALDRVSRYDIIRLTYRIPIHQPPATMMWFMAHLYGFLILYAISVYILFEKYFMVLHGVVTFVATHTKGLPYQMDEILPETCRLLLCAPLAIAVFFEFMGRMVRMHCILPPHTLIRRDTRILMLLNRTSVMVLMFDVFSLVVNWHYLFTMVVPQAPALLALHMLLFAFLSTMVYGTVLRDLLHGAIMYYYDRNVVIPGPT